MYASDGFIDVTGYDRQDLIPRNCRFLQGPLTDKRATERMGTAIRNKVDSVELILNYRKNGDPFWNLLYITPLFDDRGNLAFYLGGQIDCSTTIHSNRDVLRILSLNDELVLEKKMDKLTIESKPTSKGTSIFTKHRRNSSSESAKNPKFVGMENVLVEKLGEMPFQIQVEAFYAAYSKVCDQVLHPICLWLILY